MGMGIGLAVLAALIIMAIYLLRAGHLSGSQNIAQHMGGCCSARSFEPSKENEAGDNTTQAFVTHRD